MKKVYSIIVCLIGFTFCIAQSTPTPNSIGSTHTAITQILPFVLKPASLVEESKRSGFSFAEQDFFDRNRTRYNLDVSHREVVRNASILNVDVQQLQRFRTSNHSTFSISLPLTSSTNIQLELVEVNIFTDDFKVVTDVHPEGIEVDLGKHYRGVVKGIEGSIAALSVFENEVMALFSTPEEGNFVLGKLENQTNGRASTQHILYKDRDLLVTHNYECKTSYDGRGYTPEELQNTNESRALTDCVRFYYEAEQDIAQNKGGQQGATNYITGMQNQVATVYANENINTRISEVFVWTNADPYNSNDTEALLNQFGNNRPNFNGDLSMLLTFRDIGGGIAWLDVLCGESRYSVSGIDDNYQNVPTYSWTIGVVAHEFGHNFGSPHTHACAWNGNNTAIDGCATTEGGCPDPGNPNNGGTVMSYCHLVDGVGINFANGFGNQPGNLIRNRVENANCLQPCDNNNNQPDYRTTNFTGPGNANPGDNIVMNFRIENIGNAAGNGTGGQDRFYINNSPDLNGNPTELQATNTASLAAGAGFDVNSGNLTIPQNTNPGTYYILFFIDADNVVNESNENNNVVSHQITIGGGGGGGLDCNNAINLNCGQVYNGTTIGKPSNVQDYNNCGEDWLESGPEAVHIINWPGGNFTAILSNMNEDLDIALLRSCNVNDCVTIENDTINTNLAAGTYYLVVDGYEGAQSAYTLTIGNCQGGGLDCNNAATVNCGQSYNGTTIGQASNINQWCTSPNSYTGPEVIYKLNWGGGAFQVSLTNLAADLDLILLGACDVANCPGASAEEGTVDENIDIANLVAGTYYIVIDGWEGAQSAYMLTIGACPGGGNQPDYSTINFTGPSNANPGGTIVMDFTIQNTGNAAGDGSGGLDRFYISNTPDLNGNYTELKSTNTASMAAGASFNVNSGNLTIPPNTNNGNYYILFFIDSDNVVNESNESNNIVSYPISIGGNSGTPDYSISNYTLDGNSNTITVSPGQTVMGSLIAQNEGNGNATQTTTGKYYYSDDNSLGANDPVVGTDNISPLGAGQQTTETETITIPTNAQLGNRFMFYKIDADNAINESDEGNNVGLVKLEVVAGTGPTANFTADKTNPCAGETVQFTSTSTGNPTSYSWSFPGGTPSTSTSANPTVTYPTAGSYNVSLTVTNNTGSDAETKNGYITAQTCVQPPVAGFTADKTTVCPGETVQFTSTSTGSPTSYNWSFSGGSPSSSTSSNPSVTYNTPGSYNVSLTVSNAGGNNTKDMPNYITVQQSCGPNWTVTPTGSNHTVIIETSSAVTINGQPISVGDYIGAFYNDNGTLKCAGKTAWTGSNVSVTVYGDDNTTGGVKEGFGNGEVFNWKMWKATTEEEMNATATYKSPNAIITHTDLFAVNGISAIASLAGSTEQTQTIVLNPGWNMISSYIQPKAPNMEDIFAPIQSQIALVKNGAGNVYFPSSAINTIGNWNIVHGYQVKVIGNSNLNLQMVGQKVDPTSLVINLSLGWNLFAYLRDTEQSIVTALAPVQANLIIVKNNAGQIYFPSAAINNIGNMKPGQGYQAKMSANAALSYNARMATPPANMHQATLLPTHYNLQRIQSGNNASLIIADNYMLRIGDEVGVFTEKGLLVGAAVYEGHTLAFPIWGDELNTSEIEGLVEGARFEVKIWRANGQKEELAALTIEAGNEVYHTDGVIQGSLQKATNFNHLLKTNSLKIYPNPSKSQATLSLELVKDAEIKVELYNLQGKLIETISQEYLRIGKHDISIPTIHLPDGLYHCNIVIGDVVHNIPLGIIK